MNFREKREGGREGREKVRERLRSFVMWANALTTGNTALGPLWPSIVSIIAPFRGIELKK